MITTARPRKQPMQQGRPLAASVAGEPFRFDAFISYAWDRPGTDPARQVTDGLVARRLHHAMLDLATPRTRRSDLRVFLDRSVQVPSADLWRGLLGNLDDSRFLVLLCSPSSARSSGVEREVRRWLDGGRDLENLLVVLCEGPLEESLPPPLRELRSNSGYDPHFLDLRWIERPEQLDIKKDVRFRDDVATLVAPIKGVSKDTLVGEELAVQQRSLRVQRRFITGLSISLVVALVLGCLATLQWNRARTEARVAQSRALAAGSQSLLTSQLDLAQLLAVEGYQRDPNPETRAALFRAATAAPQLVRYWHADSRVEPVTAPPDGSLLVAGTDDGTVHRWSPFAPDLGAGILRLPESVLSLAVNGDGSMVAATDGTTARLWTEETGTTAVDGAMAWPAEAVGLSPSGRWLAVAGSPPAGSEEWRSTLALIDTRTGSVTHADLRIDATDLVVPNEHELTAIGVAGSWQRLTLPSLDTTVLSEDNLAGVHLNASGHAPDGAFFTFTNGDDQLPVWRTDAGPNDFEQPDWSVPVPGIYPEAVAVAPGGSRVAIADTGAITVLETETGAPPVGLTQALTGNATVNANGLRFLDEGRTLLSTSGSAVALWDLDRTSRIGERVPAAVPYACNACPGPSVMVSPDGRRLAVLDGLGLSVTVMDAPSAGSIDDGHDLVLSVPSFEQHDSVEWSADSRRLTVRGRPAGTVDVHVGSVDRPVRQTVTVPSDNHPVLIDRLEEAYPEVEIVSRDAPLDDPMSVASRRATEVLDSAAREAEVDEFTLGPVALSPDRSLAVRVVDSDVWVADLEERTIDRVSIGDAVTAAFTKSRLLISRETGAVEVRDPADLEVVGTLRGGPRDNRLLVTSPETDLAARLRDDATVVLVDVARIEVIGSLGDPSIVIYGLAPGLSFTPDGRRLVVVSPYDPAIPGSGDVREYAVTPDAWLRVACRTAGRDMTADEWRQYVNDSVPDDLTCARSG